jgi:hypothetical protein
VLRYDFPSFDSTADAVYGQPDFATAPSCWAPVPPPSAVNLCEPRGVEAFQGDLYVADRNYHRVLVFNGCASNNDAFGGPWGGSGFPWIPDGTAAEGASTGCDTVDLNDDNDLRCTDPEELGDVLAQGGQRNPRNPWDFADVPAPALPAAGVRNGAVSLTDVGAALEWVGRTFGNGIDAEGHNYLFDTNGNSIIDGREYDRTPNGQISGPPNGAVSLSDVGVILAQVGDSCTAAPN